MTLSFDFVTCKSFNIEYHSKRFEVYSNRKILRLFQIFAFFRVNNYKWIEKNREREREGGRRERMIKWHY